ncbi:hypothetical protein PHYPO_G00166040 [Pangasianodon hypophthalmus]|uniref:Uncharacterized protein n=1 Tax=Pangasianodon hypophthalmus TaxID=310915 RepID=A0A5N5JL91_PANHP|nr:hypothetical protein PHYPO_G00166040 [Pangasianodon hypophthalmus]
MVKLLAPVKTATTMMFEEEQPTVSVIAPLQAKLSQLKTRVITEMKQAMAKDLEHRDVDVRQVLYRASALDPRFKKLPFLSEEDRDATFQDLIHEAAELLIQKNMSLLPRSQNH